MIMRLTYRQKTIVKLHYGLGGSYSYDFDEIARIMKLDCATVKRLFAIALHKLQSRKRQLVQFV